MSTNEGRQVSCSFLPPEGGRAITYFILSCRQLM